MLKLWLRIKLLRKAL
uniref:Uncharacterized protein n=1 Tax=Rhizophora mucronata TaxID=61149 RepID=A0A2P2Q2Y8_RHIMU